MAVPKTASSSNARQDRLDDDARQRVEAAEQAADGPDPATSSGGKMRAQRQGGKEAADELGDRCRRAARRPGIWPAIQTPNVTAGLKCAPTTAPIALTRTASARPWASATMIRLALRRDCLRRTALRELTQPIGAHADEEEQERAGDLGDDGIPGTAHMLRPLPQVA